MNRLASIHLSLFLFLLGISFTTVRFGGLPSRVLLLPVVILPIGLGIDGGWHWYLRRQAALKEARKHEPIQP
jgi:uncharacterized iron-regulated membrane protein